jgi:hypothetical protein
VSRSGLFLPPPGKTRYLLYRRLGGPQGRYEHVWKISSSPGFDPQTVHPVASRYTDRATWPTGRGYCIINLVSGNCFGLIGVGEIGVEKNYWLADRGNHRAPLSLPSVSLSVASIYVPAITADELG